MHAVQNHLYCVYTMNQLDRIEKAQLRIEAKLDALLDALEDEVLDEADDRFDLDGDLVANERNNLEPL